MRRQAAEARETRIVWHTEVKTPPVSEQARREIGLLLRRLQDGENLGMPHSRPMPSIGPRVHELRVNDADQTWRLIYRIEGEVIIALECFSKKTPATPKQVIASCKRKIAGL